MTGDTQPEAMDLADWLEAVGGGPSAKRCAALLREQHTRIADLEAQLEAIGAGGVQALSAAPADVEDAIAWLVTWKGGEHTYVHAHASELPAVTQARVMGGTVTPCVAALAASPTPPAEQQAASSAVLKAIHEANMQLVRTGDDAFMLVPYKVATVEQQAAPKAAPGPVSDTQHSQFLSDVLTAAGLITHGKQCKALGARLSDMVMRLRAAPKQEVQEHHGWLYEWTHSSATGKPDSTYTAFTTDGAHARKHDNCRAIYAAPKSAPAGVLEDAARWHWMAEYIVGTRTDLDDELIACPTVDELRKLVDADLAARKQGANHDKT